MVPFGCAVRMLEESSARRPAGRLRTLGISQRTMDAHRARLLRRLKVEPSGNLICRLTGLS